MNDQEFLSHLNLIKKYVIDTRKSIYLKFCVDNDKFTIFEIEGDLANVFNAILTKISDVANEHINKIGESNSDYH